MEKSIEKIIAETHLKLDESNDKIFYKIAFISCLVGNMKEKVKIPVFKENTSNIQQIINTLGVFEDCLKRADTVLDKIYESLDTDFIHSLSPDTSKLDNHFRDLECHGVPEANLKPYYVGYIGYCFVTHVSRKNGKQCYIANRSRLTLLGSISLVHLMGVPIPYLPEVGERFAVNLLGKFHRAVRIVGPISHDKIYVHLMDIGFNTTVLMDSCFKLMDEAKHVERVAVPCEVKKLNGNSDGRVDKDISKNYSFKVVGMTPNMLQIELTDSNDYGYEMQLVRQRRFLAATQSNIDGPDKRKFSIPASKSLPNTPKSTKKRPNLSKPSTPTRNMAMPFSGEEVKCPWCLLYFEQPPSSNIDLPEVVYSLESENVRLVSPDFLYPVSSTSFQPQTPSKAQPISSNEQSEKQEDEGVEKGTSALLPQRMFVNLPPEGPANFSPKKSRGESSQFEEEFFACVEGLPRKQVTHVHVNDEMIKCETEEVDVRNSITFEAEVHFAPSKEGASGGISDDRDDQREIPQNQIRRRDRVHEISSTILLYDQIERKRMEDGQDGENPQPQPELLFPDFRLDNSILPEELELNLKKLVPGGVLQIMPMAYLSVNEFYAVLAVAEFGSSPNQISLKKLKRLMNPARGRLNYRPLNKFPVQFNLVLARHTLDSMFYRAIVVAVKDKNNIQVMYIDLGTMEMLPLTRIFCWDPFCNMIPSQAFICRFKNIRPNQQRMDGKERLAEVMEMAMKRANQPFLPARVVDYKSNGRVDIQMFDEQNYNIPQQLYGLGCAAPQKSIFSFFRN